jgi:hypothetical protein
MLHLRLNGVLVAAAVSTAIAAAGPQPVKDLTS